MKLDKLLTLLEGQPQPSALQSMVLVVDWLRPKDPLDADSVEARMSQLQGALEAHPELYTALSLRLREWLSSSRFFQLLASMGVLSRRGFLKEFGERLYDRLSPAPVDSANMKDAFAVVFRKRNDRLWVMAVSDDAWLIFLRALWRFSADELRDARLKFMGEALYAIEMLSIWVAAEELEPNLLRLDPRVVEKDSAFVAQQRELFRFVDSFAHWLNNDDAEYMDDAHARVLLEQCAKEVARLRKRAVVQGSSIALTHLLERLDQTLTRIEHLLDMLDPADPGKRLGRAMTLFKELVGATVSRRSLSALWQQNIKLLSRSVTENASDHGEHYITRDRREYLQMLGSGLGGGVIIAFMALIKVQITGQGYGEGTETLLASLNYGMGFMLIHMLGFTVATKQPAMTAARIAEQVEKGEQGRANARKMAALLVDVGRSQFVAIFGNVAAALSVAFLLGWGYHYYSGAELLSGERAEYYLNGLRPIAGMALLYAAIAGVWLFVAGLVAGFFDNRAAYIDMPGRIEVHPLLRRLLPASWRRRLAVYMGENYGALVGNFVFGVLLGCTGYVGALLGLKVDIRHVAFSSADLGFVTAGLWDHWQTFLVMLGFVLLIGMTNLVVSFTLALNVALRARGVKISGMARLLKALWQEVRQQPLALLYPPRRPVPAEAGAEGKKKAGAAAENAGEKSDKKSKD